MSLLGLEIKTVATLNATLDGISKNHMNATTA